MLDRGGGGWYTWRVLVVSRQSSPLSACRPSKYAHENTRFYLPSLHHDSTIIFNDDVSAITALLAKH